MLFDKTLEELDGIDWGEPVYPSNLVVDCHRLRRVALKDFTDFDLGRMIKQKFSLDYLVPVALARLLDDTFAGDSYDGELINSIAGLPAAFWIRYPDLSKSLDLVAKNASGKLPRYTEEYGGEIDSAVAKFLTGLALD